MNQITEDAHSRARQNSTPEDSCGATPAIPIQTIVMGYGAEQEDSNVCQEIIQTVVMDIVKLAAITTKGEGKGRSQDI
ncbi:hypothetical protein ACLB2K_077356 [Fragaria x ananassa]